MKARDWLGRRKRRDARIQTLWEAADEASTLWLLARLSSAPGTDDRSLPEYGVYKAAAQAFVDASMERMNEALGPDVPDMFVRAGV